jgi:hypothetical protein
MALSADARLRLIIALTNPGAGKEIADAIDNTTNGSFVNLALTGALTDSATGGLSATGTTQGTALALTTDLNYFSTVAATLNTGAKLPAAAAGRDVLVMNGGANPLNIYPLGASDVINGLGATNPTVLPSGQLAWFSCATAGVWNTLLLTPRQVQTAIATVGAGTLTAAGIVGGFILRGGAQTATPFSDATDTAAAIIAALHGATVGQSWVLTIQNNTNAPQTITNGAGVTVSGVTIIPANMWAEFLVTFSAAGAVTMVGVGMGANAQLPPTQYTSIATGNGTLTGAQVAGARHVTLLTSGATAQTTPTAANILAAIPNGQIGDSYVLRIVNSNGGTLTITADASVTATGTLTLATQTWREWYVTITGATTATMKQIGTGTNS